MKTIFQSKTVWVAIIQAIISVLIVIFTEADLVGYVGIVKSVGDIVLRMITKTPIGLT